MSPFQRVSSLTLLWAATLASALVGCSGDEESADAGGVPANAGTFDALSYNVAGLPQGISGSNPETNIPLISPLLNAYDVVLVQEDFVYHDELASQALHPYQSVPKEATERLVADGLNRFARIGWSSFERVQWQDCFGDAVSGEADCLAEKGFSVARMVLTAGIELDVYNHHADAGAGAEDVAARVANYEQLALYVEQHSAGRAVLMAGDTNLHGADPYDGPVLADFLAATGLEDACAYLACGDTDRIDRFLFRSSDQVAIEPTAWALADEFVDAQGDDLSDHLAVHVTVAWSRREPSP